MPVHRIAIVGTGSSVGNHLRAFESLQDRVELVAAVDLNETRLNEVCERYRIPARYTSVADMLAQEKPDLVNIITPPSTHKDISIACLEAGAWVCCEKPLCASLAEFDEIAAAEKRTGCYVSTVFQWRFGSSGKYLKTLMQQGAFGRMLVGVCNTLWYRTQAYYDVPWRSHYTGSFGGPTMTLGIHLVDFLLWLMGDWQEVHAMMDTLDHDIEVEDISMAMVRFKDGSMASIINSALSPRQETYLRLDFQKVTLELSDLYRYDNNSWKISLPPGCEDDALLELWTSQAENIPGSHHTQFAEIMDSMEADVRPPVSGDEARRIIEFIASLYKSAAGSRPVMNGELTPDDPFYYANNGQRKT